MDITIHTEIYKTIPLWTFSCLEQPSFIASFLLLQKINTVLGQMLHPIYCEHSSFQSWVQIYYWCLHSHPLWAISNSGNREHSVQGQLAVLFDNSVWCNHKCLLCVSKYCMHNKWVSIAFFGVCTTLCNDYDKTCLAMLTNFGSGTAKDLAWQSI